MIPSSPEGQWYVSSVALSCATSDTTTNINNFVLNLALAPFIPPTGLDAQLR